MAIIVDDRYKVLFVKILGPNKLFATFEMDDQAKRKSLSDEEAVKLFDRAWQTHNLERHIAEAQPVDPDKAFERIRPTFRAHFHRDEEHREFRHQRLELEFVAQLTSGKQEEELTQLWPVQSKDYDPRMLPVWFDTVDQKKQFEALAALLKKQNGSFLAKELLLDFMRKFPAAMIEAAMRQLPSREEN